MDHHEIRAHLFGLTTRGIKYDLDRMREAAHRCGNPQKHYPCFHVAGTNGKGSVCAFLESSIRRCGKKTGLFTSPHLVRFEERFMISGMPVSENGWVDVYRDLRQTIDECELTFFEASTLIAFELFRRERVDWAVFETGLGGRLDATNVVKPRVSVITRLALDHQEYLGSTLASVAGEKLGIVKKNVPLVMAAPALEEIKAAAEARCAELNTFCIMVDECSARQRTEGAEGCEFQWGGCAYRVNMRGAYQLSNALTALHALQAAGFTDWDRIAQGIERTILPGRFQVVPVRGRTVVFDVGHNPDAALVFSSALRRRFGDKEICIVTGIMKDKDIGGIMAAYSTAAHRIICTEPKGSAGRAALSAELCEKLPSDFSGLVEQWPDLAAAVEAAFSVPGEIICIAGSFYTVGEAMEYLGVEPFPIVHDVPGEFQDFAG